MVRRKNTSLLERENAGQVELPDKVVTRHVKEWDWNLVVSFLMLLATVGGIALVYLQLESSATAEQVAARLRAFDLISPTFSLKLPDDGAPFQSKGDGTSRAHV